MAIKYVWEENSPRRPGADAGSLLPCSRSGPGPRPPAPPSHDSPARCCCLEPGGAWWPQIRPLIALGDRHPADQPCAYRSSHRPGREESSPAGGPELGSAPRFQPARPGLSWRPSGRPRPRSCLALPPPLPLPRLKLINGSAYHRRHRLRALSARHIYLLAEQKAHRGAGSCAPALVRARGGGGPKRLAPSPPPLHTRGLVAGEAGAAGAQLRGPHAQPRAEGGRAPPLGDNQRSHLNSPRSARGRRRPGRGGGGRGLQREGAQPPAAPPLLPGSWLPEREQRGARLCAPCVPGPRHTLADPAGPALAPREALSAQLIGSQPEISLPALSVFLITLKHTHTHTREQANRGAQGEEGKKKPENQRRSGTVGGFNT